MLANERLERYIQAIPQDEKRKRVTFMRTRLSEKSLVSLFDLLHDSGFKLVKITSQDWDNAVLSYKESIDVEEDTFIKAQKKIEQ